MKRGIVAMVLWMNLAGCAPPLHELQHTEDRIWMVTEDRKMVIRCWDFTPEVRPFRGAQLEVYCKAAPIYNEAAVVGTPSSEMHQAPTTVP